MTWHDFDKELWQNVVLDAGATMEEFEYEILASDHSAKAVEIAKANITNAHLQYDIKLSKQDMFAMVPPEGGGIMIINPPYGERLEEKDLINLYKGIGDALKKNFKGFEAWIISSNKDALKLIGLKPSKKIDIYNGPLECKFEKFEIFEGSYKDKKIRENN